MDPLTSISLVANIAAFIDFGFKIVAAAREVKGSTTGTTATNVNAETLAISFQAIAANVKQTHLTGDSTPDEIRLIKLVDECQRLSEELLRLLGSLKVKKLGSRRHVLGIALRNFIKKSQRDELEARLDRCRNQLQLEIFQRTNDKSLERLKAIAETGEYQANELAVIKGSLKSLQSTTTTTKLDSTSLQGLNTLLKLCGQAFESAALSRLLASIGFEKMSDRLENIADAHATTFNWLLDDSDAVDPKATLGDPKSLEAQEWLRYTEVQDAYRKRSRDSLTLWLSEGYGIFHIFGKPGSGKSTLLKHLLKHPTAHELLQTWAGNKSLVKSSFFFWKGGSDGQKTLSGLYRSLLCSVFKQCPELVSLIAPSHWQLCLQGGNVELTDSEARSTFLDLIGRDEVFTHRKFVLIIDGLDEFEGDDTGLVRTLLDWTRLRPDGIKICVSSRELPLFQERFSSYPKLRLHEVTSLDIMDYVKSTLEQNEDLSATIDHNLTLRLGQRIIAKAEGVFLWVSLVLRIVERGLLQEDHPKDLEAKIDGLPTELEELFKVIFKGIELESHPIDRRRAMIILSLCLTRTKHYLSDLPLYQLSFLDEYEADYNFILRIPGPTEEKDDKERLRRCRKQVNGRCRGLVSVTASSSPNPEAVMPPTRRAEFVTITHRSLLEFFSRTEVRTVIELQTQGFNAIQFTCRSFVAQQVTEPDASLVQEVHLYTDLTALFKMTWRTGTMSTPAVTQILLDLEIIPFLLSPVKVPDQKRYRSGDYAWPFLWRRGCTSHRLVTAYDNRTVADLIIFLALEYGVPELLAPHGALEAGLLAQTAQSLGPQFLLIRAFLNLMEMPKYDRDGFDHLKYDRLLKCVAMCLRDGASPNIAIAADWKQPEISPEKDSMMETPATLWEILIWSSLCGWDDLDAAPFKGRQRLSSILPIWVLFLAYGADIEFELKFEPHHSVVVYQDAISVIGLFGEEKKDLFTPLFIPRTENVVVDMASKQDGLLSFSDVVGLLFPDEFPKLLPLINREAKKAAPDKTRVFDILKSFGLDLEQWSPPPPAPNLVLFPEIKGLSISKVFLRNMYPCYVDDPERGMVVYSHYGIELRDPNNPELKWASLID
ncbi:hypothetical protein B0T21DRAFT_411949 [Apiosordaria backusii]|uniref:NACHT domain-containing protein n=1 Tax=Apiosordaria backusii TaxID=314023 RepID=A0AA40BJE9_9PEZI|nr:hypothetical protein B0T21DRAFT_411949 [Apiosordaria backusii]